MLSKEELIEVMAEAYFNSTFPNDKWDKIFEETRAAFRVSIEAALKALCGALPDPAEYFEADISYQLYERLKQLGKEVECIQISS